MTREQKELIAQARDSIKAAKLLHKSRFHGFAASRAYYAMFYATQALLLSKGFTFSKHSAVVAAFGEHFVKTGIVPPDFHRFLIRAFEVRHAGDYGGAKGVTAVDAADQIANAEKFLKLSRRVISSAK